MSASTSALSSSSRDQALDRRRLRLVGVADDQALRRGVVEHCTLQQIEVLGRDDDLQRLLGLSLSR